MEVRPSKIYISTFKLYKLPVIVEIRGYIGCVTLTTKNNLLEALA